MTTPPKDLAPLQVGSTWASDTPQDIRDGRRQARVVVWIKGDQVLFSDTSLRPGLRTEHGIKDHRRVDA